MGQLLLPQLRGRSPRISSTAMLVGRGMSLVKRSYAMPTCKFWTMMSVEPRPCAGQG